MIVVALLIIGGAGYAFRDMWYPSAQPYVERTIESVVPPSEALNRIDTLDQRLAAIEATQKTLAEDGATIAKKVEGAAKSTEDLASQVKKLGDGQEKLASVQVGLAKTVDGFAEASGKVSPAMTDLINETKALRTDMNAAITRLAKLEESVAILEGKAPSASAGASAEASDAAAAAIARRLEAQTARVTALEKKIGQAMEVRGSAVERAASQERSTDLNARIAAAETRISALASSLEGADLQALMARVAAVEGEADAYMDVAAKATTKAVAFARLGSALQGSAPFKSELDAALKASESDKEVTGVLESVSAYASTGVPTTFELQRRFADVSDEIAQTKYKLSGDDIMARTFNRLSDLVSVRETGEAAEGVDGELADAHAAVARGDLASATAQLEKLDGELPASAEAWVKDAKARIAVDGALDWLTTYAATAATSKEG